MFPYVGKIKEWISDEVIMRLDSIDDLEILNIDTKDVY